MDVQKNPPLPACGKALSFSTFFRTPVFPCFQYLRPVFHIGSSYYYVY